MMGRLRQTLKNWKAAWSADIPPHSYALLRIALGAIGLISLAGLTPVDMFWALDGLSPLPSDGIGPRPWLYSHGYGTVAGWVLFLGLAAVFVAVTVGYRSNAAVLAGFVGLIGQQKWNPLPLSSAHQVQTVLMFCLLWADSGRVWSVDARHQPSGSRAAAVPAWPLILMRCQIALIYCSSGLYKLTYPIWLDGSAVHIALSLNAFHRFPWAVPTSWAPLLAVMTWGTVFFELFFPLLVLFRSTRPYALLGGVGLHGGLWAALELGPFSPLMVASYLAFLDPQWIAKRFDRKASSSIGHDVVPAIASVSSETV
jgi:hypothetical protein